MTDKNQETKQLIELGYSDRAIELYLNDVNFGVMEKSDAGAVIQGSSGDLIRLYIKLNGETIEDAKFLCFGCPGSLAAMAALTLTIKGQSLNDAKKLAVDDILKELGGLPETKQECAEIALKTLKKAIASYEKSNVP
ncbi:MAG: iron-sulfur cluster assembly scaffold protein [Candidatus Bathyarchaeia archaeon]